jgi:hypothetical protein
MYHDNRVMIIFVVTFVYAVILATEDIVTLLAGYTR